MKLPEAKYPDDVVRILVAEYLTTCKRHIVLDTVDASDVDPTP
jgi:hypothetical protein